MTQLLFIHHAETDLAGTFRGSSDPQLNYRAYEQLHQVAFEFASTPVHRIYTSDLLRARQSAEHLASFFSAPLIVEPDLREIDFGAWRRSHERR